MVLWEIALGTAYFLGLKRTYRLALKLQRRLVSPNQPKIRLFLHRRTHAVFNAAITVHQNIQQRDIEVGRNLGNWILRWLDRMKPSAHIRGNPPGKSQLLCCSTGRQAVNPGQQPLGNQRPNNSKITDQEADRRFFSSAMNVRPKTFPTLAMMLRPMKAVGMSGQCRHVYSAPVLPKPCCRSDRFVGVFRKDIMQWMLQND
ncbi:uncharacterized protein LOC131248000 [Magnolia sinica]|uniref:uncharacterized protein LOC131248000 n=1 Tax=Magnolia sinica TaxID=86752 RepID=UPI002658CB1E|nr:uncharacterized protein LOC131248000 [Magnolia sinica]